MRPSPPSTSLSSMLCRISQPAHLSPSPARGGFGSRSQAESRRAWVGRRGRRGESGDGVKQACCRAGESVPGKRGGYLPPRGLAARRLELRGSGGSSGGGGDGAAGGSLQGRGGGIPFREEADSPLHR